MGRQQRCEPRASASGQPARALAHGQSSAAVAARQRQQQRPGRQRAAATRAPGALAGMRAAAQRTRALAGIARLRAASAPLAGMRGAARTSRAPGRHCAALPAHREPRPCAPQPACNHMWWLGLVPVLPTFSSYSLFDGIYYSDNRSNSRANTCNKPRLLEGMHLLDKRSTQALPVALMIHDNSSDRTAFVPATHHSNFCPINFRCWTLGWVDRSASGVHRLARPFCRRCAPGLNWPGRASGAVTLKKLECSKQAYALDTLAWDNTTGF
ncbi:hypothetical protein VNO78_38764 [Psophocarpus tetragonolobus]|uniref:Uncharacterized protein n=1 Tax=Psophocarpus tetragonolobus TaxID=3891 RepID=A0AAN9N3D0_PSOTE